MYHYSFFNKLYFVSKPQNDKDIPESRAIKHNKITDHKASREMTQDKQRAIINNSAKLLFKNQGLKGNLLLF